MSTAPQIDEAYVKTGKVRVVFRHRAVLGEESIWAAEASLCAAEQGKFWEYHQMLFVSRFIEKKADAYTKPGLKRLSAELGLDSQSFDPCLDNDKYLERVRSETMESGRRGVLYTPTFFINDTKIEGAYPFEEFEAAIEAQLRR